MESGTLLADRYRLTDRIGTGGTTTVWRAFDTVVDRLVAAKILTQGAKPADMPVETQKDLTLYVNKAAAERMGVTLTDDVLAGAEVVG